LIVTLLACTRGEPPSLVSTESESVAPMPPAPSKAVPSASVVASASASPSVDEATLPQTHDKPTSDSDAFRARAEALFEAIQNDDPDRAMIAFFPRAAYEQVKAITNPASDWRYRLVANFKRDIHEAHAKLGRKSTALRFIGLDVGAGARWVESGEEGNKLGYYRAYGSHLRFSVEGQERAIDVTSLISWRGEWYVVHLTGFT